MLMKPTLWTTLLALTVACLGDGLLFEPTAPASEQPTSNRDVVTQTTAESHIQFGLQSVKTARR